jgi:hypothetical protein
VGIDCGTKVRDALGDAALSAFDQAQQVMRVWRAVFLRNLRFGQGARAIEIAALKGGDGFGGS